MDDQLFAPLAEILEAGVQTDLTSRVLYATDASPYQVIPQGVVQPCTRDECIRIVEFSTEKGLSLIARGGGTSLAGQCVGTGLIVDMSRNMNRVLAVDVANRLARVEPGVVPGELNTHLAEFGLMFAPDPSTLAQCTIGGMVGNNAWGAHAVSYGDTRQNVVSMQVVLADGSTALFEPLDAHQLEYKRTLNSMEGDIYRQVHDLISCNREEILKRYPNRDIPNNSGYALDQLAYAAPWDQRGELFNLSTLICGSEGTLCLVTEITVKLIPIPADRILVCAHFRQIDDALRAVKLLSDVNPSALELLDHFILGLTKGNPQQSGNRFWIEGEPAAVLMVELHSGTEEGEVPLKKRADEAIALLQNAGQSYSCPVLVGTDIDKAWMLRRSSLGLLMGMHSSRRPVTAIEDCSVNISDLAPFAADVRNYLSGLEVDVSSYGSVSKGLVHFRPLLNLNDQKDRFLFEEIMDGVAQIVHRYGGSFSAKHGDGRLRARWLGKMLGSELLKQHRLVKCMFDPEDLFNPNKVFSAPPLLEDLRYPLNPKSSEESYLFNWSQDRGFINAASRCHGAAACRKRSTLNVMCPSYRASGQELLSTRGRANLIRYFQTVSAIEAEELNNGLLEALASCLGCKSCRSECPANVDISRLKAELLQQQYDRNGTPARVSLIANFDRASRYMSRFPTLSNRVLDFPGIKKLLGFHQSRYLPKLAHQSFSRWFRAHRKVVVSDGHCSVVLINDPHTEYYEPGIGIAAVRVLEALGYRVRLTPVLSSGRVQISQGLVRSAVKRINEAIDILEPLLENSTPIVGLEPSELLTFRDEVSDLVSGKRLRLAQRLSDTVMLFEEFVAQVMQRNFKPEEYFVHSRQKVLIHLHCHQRALSSEHTCIDVIAHLPGVEASLLPASCCGMAGAFGYQTSLYELSMEVAEQALFPAIRAADNNSVVVATGTSCRQQIRQGLSVKALHPAELMEQFLR